MCHLGLYHFFSLSTVQMELRTLKNITNNTETEVYFIPVISSWQLEHRCFSLHNISPFPHCYAMILSNECLGLIQREKNCSQQLEFLILNCIHCNTFIRFRQLGCNFSFYNHFEIIHISFQLKCIIYSCMKTYFFTQITFQFFFYSKTQYSRNARIYYYFFFIYYKIEIYFFLKISEMLYRVKIVMICDE